MDGTSDDVRAGRHGSRRAFCRRAVGVAFFGLTAARRGEASCPEDVWSSLRDGDLLLSRKAGWNYVPGYWNHVALVHEGYAVEAQLHPGRVIATPLDAFQGRVKRVRVRRLREPQFAGSVASHAAGCVGRPYSLLPDSGCFNCVRLIRFAFRDATGSDPWWWRLPDHLAMDRRHWDTVATG